MDRREKKKQKEMSAIVLVVTTSLNAGSQNMINSLQKFNWDYKIEGLGQKWEGFKTKMQIVAEFCESIDPQTIVIVVDIYDALCVRDSTSFVKDFESHDVDVIFGGESVCEGNCIPLDEYWKHHESISSRIYLQGGCTIGRAHALSSVYRAALTYGINDDQMSLSRYVNENVDKNFMIDQKNQFGFHVYTYMDHDRQPKPFEWVDDKLKIMENGLFPYFVHFPGFLRPSSMALMNMYQGKENLGWYKEIGSKLLGPNLLQINQDHWCTRYHSSMMWVGIMILMGVIILLLVLLCGYYAGGNVMLYHAWKRTMLRSRKK